MRRGAARRVEPMRYIVRMRDGNEYSMSTSKRCETSHLLTSLSDNNCNMADGKITVVVLSTFVFVQQLSSGKTF